MTNQFPKVDVDIKLGYRKLSQNKGSDMAYVYRYDNWASHMHMEGGQLRARYWNKQSFPHDSLIAIEKDLPAGKGIYRISFWKTEKAMLEECVAVNGQSLQVIQRIKEDQPFLQSLTKEDDDKLKEKAWLYWKTADYADGQKWSDAGIPKSDIEVLDFDGAWRPFNQSEIMRPEADSFNRLGFDTFHYLMGSMEPATTFAKCKWMEIDGVSQFVVVIANPICHMARAHNERTVLKHIFQEMRRQAIDIPLSQCRIFILDDSFEMRQPNLVELPLREKVNIRRHRNKLFGIIPWWVRQEEVNVDFNSDLKWRSHEEKLFDQIVDEFSIPNQIERKKQYSTLLREILSKLNLNLSYPWP